MTRSLPMRQLGSLAAVLATCFGAPAAGAWTSLYDGPAHLDEIANALARDAAGNVYVAGSTTTAQGTTDVLLVKFSPTGTLLWQVTSDPSSGGDDVAAALALDSAGNPIVAGSTRPGLDSDVLVQKYTSAGALAWQRTYSSPVRSDDEAVAVGVDASDRIVACGTRVSPPVLGQGSADDYLFLEYAADGTPGWVLALDGGDFGADYPTALAVMPDGEAVATGLSTRADATTDIFTVRLRANGTTRWTRLFAGAPGDDDWGLAVVLDPAGNAYLTGFIETGAASCDCVTLAYDADGALAWARTFDGPLGDHDSGHAIAVDATGSVFVTGATRDAGGAFDALTLKYDAAGTLAWSRVASGPGDGWDEGGMIVPDGAGGAVCAAQSASAAGDLDIVTLHYDSGGTLAGQSRYDGSAHDVDSPCGVLLAGPSLIVVAGMSAETGGGDDVVVSAFDPSALVAVFDPQSAPTEVALGPIEPHPLRTDGWLRFELPRDARVTLELIDVAGRRVAVLAADERIPAGRHVRRLDLPSLHGGIYFVRLIARDDTGEIARRRKLVFLP